MSWQECLAGSLFSVIVGGTKVAEQPAGALVVHDVQVTGESFADTDFAPAETLHIPEKKTFRFVRYIVSCALPAEALRHHLVVLVLDGGTDEEGEGHVETAGADSLRGEVGQTLRPAGLLKLLR